MRLHLYVVLLIIATGFDVEQQKLIVNANDENKSKIIHHLGEEQKATADLLANNAPAFTNAPTPEQPLQSNSGFQAAPKIVYNLDDDSGNQLNNEVEKKTIVQTQPTNIVQNVAQPVQTTNNVTENQPQNVQQHIEVPQTIVKTVDIRNIVVNEPTFVIVKPKQVIAETQNVMAEQFTFDLQQQENQFESFENEFSFEIQQSNVQENQVQQNQAIEKADEIVRYDLSDYMEVEDQLMNSKQNVEEPVKEDESFSFTVRTEEPTFVPQTQRVIVDENSPMETSINDILRERAEERKRKMKEFNHKFNTATNQINDLEKEPAYKRMGVDLTQNNASNVSRTSVSSDRNNDVQLRSNNSFLHDNVD